MPPGSPDAGAAPRPEDAPSSGSPEVEEPSGELGAARSASAGVLSAGVLSAWAFREAPARSPAAALAALLGAAVLAAGVAGGRPALAAAILGVQVVLGLGWLMALRASLPTAALVGVAALACDALLLRSTRADAGSVAGVLGLALLAAMLLQLFRRNRNDVTAGLAAAVSGVVLMA